MPRGNCSLCKQDIHQVSTHLQGDNHRRKVVEILERMPVEQKLEQAWYSRAHVGLDGSNAPNKQVFALWDHVAAKATLNVNDLNVVAEGTAGPVDMCAAGTAAGKRGLQPASSSSPVISDARSSASMSSAPSIPPAYLERRGWGLAPGSSTRLQYLARV